MEGKNQFKHAESIWSWREGNSSTRQRQDDGDRCFLSPTDCARIGLVLRYITDMHISIRGRFLKAFIDGEMVSAIESSFNVDVGRRGVLNDNLKPLLTNCEFIEVKYLSFWMNKFICWQYFKVGALLQKPRTTGVVGLNPPSVRRFCASSAPSSSVCVASVLHSG